MCTMETRKNKTKHKHAHEGTLHSVNEMKLDIIALQV
jgi:hypothetical protein